MTDAVRCTLTALAATLALGWAAAGPALAQAGEEERRGIAVMGEGEAHAAPDMALVTLGVVSEAETAREALAANSDTMAGIVAALREAGIAERDLQTSGLSVEPRIHYPEPRRGAGREAPEIVGYLVRNNLTVRIRDLEEAGGLLDQAVRLGSNYLTGIGFTLADPAPLLAEARRAAMADARQRAELYAEAAGVELGPLLRIEERDEDAPRPTTMRSRAAEAADAGVPIERGEITLRARLQAVWRIGE